MRKQLFVTTALFLSFANLAVANTIGTAYQNFNPSVTGLDFTTVESSKILKPCMCNLGLFVNYAKNNLTYSGTDFATGDDLSGRRANDYLVGADLNLAFGLTKNWDFGVALPFNAASKNQDPYSVTYFDKFSLTEIRPMTKYRWWGDDSGGFATVLSANFDRLEIDPLAGEKPGPTLNFELVADTTTDSGMKVGVNLGYRKRSPGQKTILTTGGNPPFEPFKDSIIFSAAVANRVDDNTDVIAEVNGSKVAQSSDSDTIKKTQEALEISLGFRNEWTKNLKFDGGFATHLGAMEATPDARVYVGLNFQFSPFCETSTPRPTEYPAAQVSNVPSDSSDQTKLNMPVTANKIAGFRWKIGSTAKMNCQQEAGYSKEISGDLVINTDVSATADGGITLCVLAKNEDGVWQSLSKPTVYTWTKKHKKLSPAPVAVMTTVPQGVSEVIEFYSPVTAKNPKDIAAYTWKIGLTPTVNCYTEDGYSVETAANIPATQSIGELPDGSITACVLAKNLEGTWQPVSAPTIYTWTKKKGYELFRLNANVLFDFNKDTLQARSYIELEKIARHLEQRPFRKVVIEGYSDSKGTDAYNLDLSQRRANRVRSYLIEKFGFLNTKLEAVGQGRLSPIASNATDDGRAKNRRVEFKVYRK